MIEREALQRHPLLRNVPQDRLRFYLSSEVCAFWFTSAEFGEFSNMAEGFPLEVDGWTFLSSEALYQICRFPSHPEVQRQIAEAANAKLAKKVSRANTAKTRRDWLRVRVDVMRWVLRVKAIQYKKDFLFVLNQTGEVPIVEESRKDVFWGAVRQDEYLVGMNILGRLLMELRRDSNSPGTNLMRVEPLRVPEFKIFAKDVGVVGPKLGPPRK